MVLVSRLQIFTFLNMSNHLVWQEYNSVQVILRIIKINIFGCLLFCNILIKRTISEEYLSDELVRENRNRFFKDIN